MIKEDRRLLAEYGGPVMLKKTWDMGTIPTTTDGIREAPGDNQEQCGGCRL